MRALYSILFLVFLAIAPVVHASQIYLDSGTEVSHRRLDTFYVPVRIDTQGACVNAVRVTLAYDPVQISVRDIATGISILTLWTEGPTVHKDAQGKEIGRVTFEGGVPGGYCGRVEGDPGLTNVLAQLVVSGVPQALQMGEATSTRFIVEPETRVYLHDGQGTVEEPTFLGATITLVQGDGIPGNVWLDDIKSDTVAPELFEIILVEGPSAGNERSYIAFSTTDKQSGIDHYEILETDPDRFGFLTWVPHEAYWVRAKSPYVLRDQKLHSKIMVKAIDKNGNERVAVYTPPMSPLVELTRLSILVPLVIVIITLILLAFFIYRKTRIKTPHSVTPTMKEDVPLE